MATSQIAEVSALGYKFANAKILRLTNFLPFAAISFLLGALISRFGWVSAGKVCACDPKPFLPRNADAVVAGR
jgi:hypothetical protein